MKKIEVFQALSFSNCSIESEAKNAFKASWVAVAFKRASPVTPVSPIKCKQRMIEQ